MDWFKFRCYQQWIEENIPVDEMMSNCTIWSRVMAVAFPELMHVTGYVRATKETMWAAFRFNYHEYLIDENGDIVDPTAKQFDMLLGKNNWEYLRCEEASIIHDQ